MYDYRLAARLNQFQKLYKAYLVKNSKRTPKPEDMFKPLIRAGVARIQRRSFKQPLLVFVAK